MIFIVKAVTTPRSRRCLLLPTFFGLTDDYMRQVYTVFFQMKKYGNWGFLEAYNLPVQLRQWFYNLLVETIKKEHEEVEKTIKGR